MITFSLLENFSLLSSVRQEFNAEDRIVDRIFTYLVQVNWIPCRQNQNLTVIFS